MSQIPVLTLNNSRVKIPVMGYGTWLAKDEGLREGLEAALEAGYRHIDTAYAYENEPLIGDVLHKWFAEGKLKRDDVFIVTKLPPCGMRPEGVTKFLKRSLEGLRLQYVDLYLIHTPFGFPDKNDVLFPFDSQGNIELDPTTDLSAIWQEMEAQQMAGLARSIGISNFNQKQIAKLLTTCKIRPANHQIEVQPYSQQPALIEYCHRKGITVTAYSPLASPGIEGFLNAFGQTVNLPDLLHNPVLVRIGEKYGKSAAQVALRHGIQRGLIVIPKSVHPEWIRENINVFDFHLDADDIRALGQLDQGIRVVNFAFFSGVEKHPEFPF